MNQSRKVSYRYTINTGRPSTQAKGERRRAKTTAKMKDIFRERVGIRHPSIIRHPLLKMMTILILIPYFLGCLVPVKAFVLDPSAATSIRSIQKSPLHAADASAGGASHLEKLKILFSDVDGALIHYPENNIYDDSSGQILELPPSATGMKGIISAKTLATCRDLRQKGLKLVLISGMRTSTLLGRLPYLPRADAYCTEAGGRIFYPIKVASFEGEEEMDSEFEQQQWTPLEFSGALPEDLQPFGLREDMTWRKRMESEQAAGKDGYAGNEVFSNRLCEEDDEDDEECLIDYENPYGFPKQQDVIPIQQRKGLLWEFARQLQDDYDFVLDTKSYSSCFRVNRKHQTGGTDDGVGKFQALLKGDIAHPLQLGKSTNLGCIDIYPVSSGKRNCCQYIADSLGMDLAKESVCVCDDDNDIEMALACSHAYIPALTSDSMVACIRENPDKLTLTYKQGLVEETAATEAALKLICECSIASTTASRIWAQSSLDN